MASACTAGLDTGFIELGYAKVAVLGVVQGITELLPISSTAHMRIVPALLGWRDPGSAFSAAMQAAALAAVISYFWSDVRGLIFGSIGAVVRRDFKDWNVRFALWIVLATFPIVVLGVLLSPLLIACNTPLRQPSAAVLEETWSNYQPGTRRPYGVMEWPALLRKLERLDPGYRS